jgi:hypothetical protein
MFSYQKNNHNQINHFFFFKESSHDILQSNFEILVLDCIYKTNKYKMLLLIIFEQIALHRNFYVTFCFMIRKKFDNYFWVLNQLKLLYKQLKLLNLIVFVTNMKKTLMNARYLIFSQFNHLFCIWHINNNVLINCKKEFATKKAWKHMQNRKSADDDDRRRSSLSCIRQICISLSCSISFFEPFYQTALISQNSNFWYK